MLALELQSRDHPIDAHAILTTYRRCRMLRAHVLRPYVLAEIERRVAAGAPYCGGHSRVGVHSVVFVIHGCEAS